MKVEEWSYIAAHKLRKSKKFAAQPTVKVYGRKSREKERGTHLGIGAGQGLPSPSFSAYDI
jgi:hypothetical protein